MDKPLHVQVAEALGQVECKAWKLWGQSLSGPEWMKPVGICGHEGCYPPGDAPRYDTLWAATGPLIELYHLHVGEEITYQPSTRNMTATGWVAGTWDSEQAADPNEDYLCGRGPTPLIAVCNAIIILRESGKLTSQEPSLLSR